MHDLFFQIVLLAIVSTFSQWVAWRLHTPAILFLLGMGFVVGPLTGLLQPTLLMGDLLEPAIAAAVSIILFEGALHLRFKDLRDSLGAVGRIIFIGAPLGCVMITAAAYYIAGLELAVAATLGGMLIVTGPTVIMPMLRQAKLTSRLSSILKWEGIVNDPIGILVAVLAYEYFLFKETSPPSEGSFFLVNGAILLIVILISFLAAHFLKYLFEHRHIPEYLKTPCVLAVILTLFYVCNLMIHESGLIAVTVLGMTLTNIHPSSLDEIRRFKETITILLVSGVFLLLTANLDLSLLLDIKWRSILFIIALLCIVRPLTIAICNIGSNLSWKEIALVGWIAPRGVVCAAMAGVLAPSLMEAGFEDGNQIIPIAFGVVIISVIAHSLTIKPLANRLELKTKESDGLIITGAHDWSIHLAEVLHKHKLPILLVDNKYMLLKEPRMAGVPTYYGELLSDDAEYALDYVKYHSLIAATYSPAYNALVCDKFAHDYGRENVFRVPPSIEERQKRIKLSQHIMGKSWTGHQLSTEKLSQLYSDGWRFFVKKLAWDEEEESVIIPKEDDGLMIMGMINKNGVLRLRAENMQVKAKKEDHLLVFAKEKPEKENGKSLEFPPAQ